MKTQKRITYTKKWKKCHKFRDARTKKMFDLIQATMNECDQLQNVVSSQKSMVAHMESEIDTLNILLEQKQETIREKNEIIKALKDKNKNTRSSSKNRLTCVCLQCGKDLSKSAYLVASHLQQNQYPIEKIPVIPGSQLFSRSLDESNKMAPLDIGTQNTTTSIKITTTDFIEKD